MTYPMPKYTYCWFDMILSYRKINEIGKSTKNMAAENHENTVMKFALEGNDPSTAWKGINNFEMNMRQTKIFLYLYECFHILPPQSSIVTKDGCEVIKCNCLSTRIHAYEIYCLMSLQRAVNEREQVNFN